MKALETTGPNSPGRIAYNRDTLMAFLWALAESTVFFIAPEVLLTRIALLRGWRQTLHSIGWALVGVALGSTLLYLVARDGHLGGIERAFDWLPGVSPDAIARAHNAIDDHGSSAFFHQLASATPLKLSVAYAGSLRLGIISSLLALLTVCAIRFAAASLVAWAFAATLGRNLAQSRLELLHLGLWTALYVVYFYHQGH